MTTEGCRPAGIEVRRLRQEALLKEYEICQQEATATANWLWASTTVFLAVLMSGLGYAAVRRQEIAGPWLLGAAAFATVTLLVGWLPFIVRSFTVRQRLFMRQRQIERELGLLKSIAIHATDNRDRAGKIKECLKPQAQEELDELLCRARKADAEREGLEWMAHWMGVGLWKIKLGRPGRSSIYVMALMVVVGWWALAGLELANVCWCR